MAETDRGHKRERERETDRFRPWSCSLWGFHCLLWTLFVIGVTGVDGVVGLWSSTKGGYWGYWGFWATIIFDLTVFLYSRFFLSSQLSTHSTFSTVYTLLSRLCTETGTNWTTETGEMEPNVISAVIPATASPSSFLLFLFSG